MRVKEIESSGGRRTFAIIFGAGDEVGSGLFAFANEYGIDAAYFTAIGALREVTLGYWNPEAKVYRRIPVREQVEVLSLSGNVALSSGGARKVHAHVVVGKADGTAHGGHLLDGYVQPTLEVMLVEAPRHLRRTYDPSTGLALIDVDA